MRKPLTRLAGALLLAGMAASVQATVLPYKTVDQLATEADGIVVGVVRQVQAVVTTPGDINTFVTIEPQEVLSGQLAQRQLTLKVHGGFDGQRGLHVEGAPQFAAGDRVLLFVQGNGREIVPFVGWTQGVFRIERDAASGEDRVVGADGQRVLGLRGAHLLRDDSTHSHVQLLGAPPLALVRQAEVEASAGTTDDGSVIVEQRATPAPLSALPTMSLQGLLAAVRERLAAAPGSKGEGKLLQSVSAADVAAVSSVPAERSALPAQAAEQDVARPADGAVAEPAGRKTAPSRLR